MDIKIFESKEGLKYFIIYEVVAVDYSDKRHALHRFLSKEAAEKDKEFSYEAFKKLYRCFYINEEIVWVD